MQPQHSNHALMEEAFGVLLEHLGPGCSKKCVAMHKKLDSPGVAPYHTPMHGGTRSLGAAGALKGQRGSFGRQPSLAPPPRGVAHGVPYYSVFPLPCVHLFLYPC